MSIEQKGTGILLEVGTNEVEFLLFRLGLQHFGINVGKICQILLFDESKVVALPNNRPDLLGLMQFREKTISIIDLKTHLNVVSVDANAKKLLLVAELNQRTVGFVIDTVDRIQRCTWNQFVPITETISQNSIQNIVGTVTLKETIVLILDLESILGVIDHSMSIESFDGKIDASSTIDRSKVSILHCEDSAVVRKTMLSALEKAGFKIFHTFSTGLEGLEFLSQSPPPSVDIILSDIEMPQMDGLTFCKKVRLMPHLQKIPFIFFSSMINDQMQEKCKSAGGDASYSKPQIQEIVNAIDEMISKK